MDKSAFDIVLLAADGGRSKTKYSSKAYYYGTIDKHQIYDRTNARMKAFFLQVPNLTPRNFMGYISPHVSTLNLVMNQAFDIWIQDCEGEEKDNWMQELDRKCCTIKDLTLSVGRPKWLSEETKAKLDNITLQDRIVAFQKFVDMIGRAHHDLLCTMDLDFYDENEDTEGRELALKIKNGVMNVKYAFPLKENDLVVLPSFLGSVLTSDKTMQ